MLLVFMEALKQFSLLLAVLYLYTLLVPRFTNTGQPWRRIAAQSLIFGFVAFVSMTISTPILHGHYSDSRSIITAVAGAMGGPIPAFVSVIFATLARSLYPLEGFYNGTVSVVIAAVMGSIYQRLEQEGRVTGRLSDLVIFGLLLAVVKLMILLWFGGDNRVEIFSFVLLPALFSYPAGFTVMYLLLRREQRLNDEARRSGEYRNQFDVAIQSSPVGILIYRAADQICLYANESVARTMATTMSGLVGKPVPLMIDVIADSFAERQSEPVAFTLPDGTQRWLLLSSRPVRFEDEQCEFVVVQDVTAQRESQQQLAFSEARFRRFADATSEGIMMVSSGQIVDANHKCAELSGYPVDELVGKSIWNVVPADEQPIIRAMMANQNEAAFTTAGLRKDGNRFPAEVMLRQVLLSGSRMWLVTLRDLTERRQAEAERLALALEREKVRTLYDFIRATSHDLRTPLAVINTSLYLAQKTRDPQRLSDQIHKAETQVLILSNILDRIYEWAQLSNLDTLPLTPVDVNTLLLNLHDRVSTHLAENQLTLTLDLAQDLPQASASISELDIAIYALLNNAMTYTPPGGRVTLRTAADDEHICIEVTDTGTGVPSDMLERVFEPFFKADPARNTGDGVGLGLTISRRIVDLHGGTLLLQNAAGGGTTARILLERAEARLSEPVRVP